MIQAKQIKVYLDDDVTMKVFFLKYLRIRVFWLLLQLVSTLFMLDDSSCYLLWIVFAFLIIDESKHKKANLDLPCINSSCLATIRNGNAFAYILLNYTHIYIGKTLSIFYPNLIWAVGSKEWPIMKKKNKTSPIHPPLSSAARFFPRPVGPSRRWPLFFLKSQPNLAVTG